MANRYPSKSGYSILPHRSPDPVRNQGLQRPIGGSGKPRCHLVRYQHGPARDHEAHSRFKCLALHHIPGITPGLGLLWPLLTSVRSPCMLPNQALSKDRPPDRSPRTKFCAPLRGIRTRTFAIQPRHLPYLLNPGLCHVVLTYPETGPCMPFLFVGSPFCTRGWTLAMLAFACSKPVAALLPSDGASRHRSCRRLMFMSKSHDIDRIHT